MRTCDISEYPINRGRYLIEASAGTGKTYTITHLVLRLILSGVPVRKILVATFSNAAAEELKTRILELLNAELDKRISGQERNRESVPVDPAHGNTNTPAPCQPDPFDVSDRDEPPRTGEDASSDRLRERILLRLAVSSIDEMTVGTIHGFCQKMLREFALKSGRGFETELIPDESKYTDRLVRAFCRNRFYDGAACSAEFGKIMQAARFASEPIDRAIAGNEIPDEGKRLEQNLCYDAYCYVKDRLQSEKDRDGVMSFNDMIRGLDEALRKDDSLAELIRSRYQAVFVDEFQDTDQLQYRIFDKCFPADGPGLFYMIGDPKQAIYRFRGADIYTYLQAKKTATAQFTLTKNFRSSPEMIRAVNRMFSDGDLNEGHETPGVFLQDDIPFVSIASGKKADDFPDNPGGCLRLRHYIGTQSGCEHAVRRDVVNEIEYLLSSDCRMRTVDGNRGGASDEPGYLRASDIAVLVQTNAQAAEFVRLLNERGIAASACKSGKIYDTKEAKLMLLLLRCFLHPGPQYVRGLMLSPFFRISCDDIVSNPGWAELLMKRMADCGRLWSQFGLPAAFLHFLDAPVFDNDISPRKRILAEFNGERAITNYIQLMELLYQKESEAHLLPEDVFSWLNLIIGGRADGDNAGGSEENPDQLRLDRDTASVQIMTMFTAKGLEFPVVFVPYPAKTDWGHMQNKTGLRSEIAFRINTAAQTAGSSEIVLDFGLSDTNQETARQEELRNGLRLLYVALTRASLATYLYTRQLPAPAPGRRVSSLSINFTKSAQGVLLTSHNRMPTESETEEPETFVERKWKDGYFSDTQDLLPRPPADWWTVLDEENEEDASFHIRQSDVFERHFGMRSGFGPLRTESRPERLEAAAFNGEIRDEWAIMSFSAFHNILNNRADEEKETPADLDEQNGGIDGESEPGASGNVPDDPSADRNLFREFPHGAAVGNMVHKLLENCAGHFDVFRAEGPDDPADMERVLLRIAGVLREFGCDSEDETMKRQLLDGISRALGISLPEMPDGCGPGIILSELDQKRMVPEMEFFLNAPASLDIQSILSILAESASDQARPLVSPEDVSFDKKGILNGIIDLVFEHGGKYYIVDWKTNWLGDSDADYAPDRIRSAMKNAGYVLQSYLYTVALVCILSQRGLNYDSFGGVYYLFLRGLKRGTRNGIWFDQPPQECIAGLLNLFFHGQGN